MPQSEIVVFDLDGTLIDADCAQEWLIFLREKTVPGAVEAELNCAAIMKNYDSGRMDMHEYMRHWVMPIKGMTVSNIDNLAIEFAEISIRQRLFPEGVARVSYHQKAGDTVLLISASPSLIVQPIAAMLGIEHVIGLDVHIHRQLVQSTLIEPLSFKAGKLTCLQKWLSQHGLTGWSLSYAYSDSINDRLLLEFAHTPVVVNGDKHIAALAEQNAWRQVHWQVPALD